MTPGKTPAILIGVGKPEVEQDAEDDTGSLAGTSLIKAIKSGDGQAVYEAFEALFHECKGAAEHEKSMDEEIESE